jgi:hypothetical protein
LVDIFPFFSCLFSLYHGLMVGSRGSLPLLYPYFYFPVWIFLGTASRIWLRRERERSHLLLGFPGLSGGFIYAHTPFGGWRGSVGKAFGKLGSGRAKRCCLLVVSKSGWSGRFGSVFVRGCRATCLSVCGIRVLGAERVGLFPACFLAYRLFPARALAAARRFCMPDMKRASTSEQASCDYGN